MQLPEPGDLFEGKYQVHEAIGQGGFATVFRATDVAMGRLVALKVLSPRDGAYPDLLVSRFMREARVFAELHAPNTITMFDFGESSDGLLFMVFEFIHGEELGAMIARSGPLDPRVTAHVLKQLLGALSEAHRLGILHRDIKPANILVFDYGGDPFNVKLIDFGIAKPVDPEHTLLTRLGNVVGTPRYMSPEQVFGDELTPASDLYSLGLVAYEMLTGKPAVTGLSRAEIRAQQLAQVPISVPSDCAPQGLRRLVGRLVEEDERGRYQSADAVLTDLRGLRAQIREWAGPRPEAPEPRRGASEAPGALRPAARERATNAMSRPAIVIAIAAVVVVAGLAAASWLRSRETATVVSRDRVARRVDARAASPTALNPEPAGADVGADGVAAQGVDGCGQPALSGSQTERAFTLESRNWVRVLPRTYDQNRRYPVVLLFHRAVASAESVLSETRLADAADRHGFVILAPNSLNSSVPWEDVSRETAFMRRMLRQEALQLCLDLSHVYALGEASGGGFATELPCHMPLSAIATTGYGSNVGGSECRPEPDVPRLRLYGKRDAHIPMAGGPGCMSFGTNFESAADTDGRWRGAHGCSEERTDWYKHAAGVCETWVCETPYVSCATNAGHEWPTAKGRLLEMPACVTEREKIAFPNDDVIWRFFESEGRALKLPVQDR